MPPSRSRLSGKCFGVSTAAVRLGFAIAAILAIRNHGIAAAKGGSGLPATFTAGVTTPGTTGYPNGGLTLAGNYFSDGRGYFSFASIDAASGYAYFVWQIDFSGPYVIHKTRLGADNSPPQKVAEWRASGLTELCAKSSVIDVADGYLYVATGNYTPTYNRIVKFALGTGDEPIGRVGHLELNPDENPYDWAEALIDTEADYAYFGVGGGIVKISLGEGDELPRRIGKLNLGQNEGADAGVIDTQRGYGYWGGKTSIVKVGLGEGASPQRRVAALRLGAGEIITGSAAIDTEHQYAYFLLENKSLLKIALGEGDAPPRRVGSVALGDVGIEKNAAVFFDPSLNQVTIAARKQDAGLLIYLDAGIGDSAPILIGSKEFEYAFHSGVYNSSAKQLVMGGNNLNTDSEGWIAKLSIGSAPDEFAVVGSTLLTSFEYEMTSLLVDREAGYLYAQAEWNSILKLKLGQAGEPLRRVGSLELPDASNGRIGALDPDRGYGYFVTWEGLLKVALGEGDANPRIVQSLYVPPYYSVSIDRTRGILYGGEAGFIDQIALGEGDAPPVLVDRLETNEYGYVAASLADPISGYSIHSLYSWDWEVEPTLRLVKVAPGDGQNPMKIVSELRIDDLDPAIHAMEASEPGVGYFLTGADYGEGAVLKIAFGVGDATPTLLSRTPTQGYYDEYDSLAALYEPNQEVFVADDGEFTRISLNPPKESRVTMYDYCEGLAIDPDRGYLFFGTAPMYNATHIAQYGVSQKGFLKATRVTMPRNGVIDTVSFYSHAAEGNVRFSIYREKRPRSLIWQSPVLPNQVAGGWINVPVSQGTPNKLALPKGDYWLGWEIDTRADVPSYAGGEVGSGMYLPKAFDSTVSDLDRSDPIPDYAKWSMHLTWRDSDVTPGDILAFLLGDRTEGDGMDFNFDGEIDLGDYLEAISVAGP